MIFSPKSNGISIEKHGGAKNVSFCIYIIKLIFRIQMKVNTDKKAVLIKIIKDQKAL